MKKLIVRKTLKGSRTYRINEMFDCPYPKELAVELASGSDTVEELEFEVIEPIGAWIEEIPIEKAFVVESKTEIVSEKKIQNIQENIREILFRNFSDMHEFVPVTKYRSREIDLEKMKRYSAPPIFKGRWAKKHRKVLFRKFAV